MDLAEDQNQMDVTVAPPQMSELLRRANFEEYRLRQYKTPKTYKFLKDIVTKLYPKNTLPQFISRKRFYDTLMDILYRQIKQAIFNKETEISTLNILWTVKPCTVVNDLTQFLSQYANKHTLPQNVIDELNIK